MWCLSDVADTARKIQRGVSAMKKAVPLILGVGFLIFLAYKVVDRFIVPIPNLIAIPVLLFTITLFIIGWVTGWAKKKNERTK
jgi:UDP-N-acetylmuramyl pentapeptide phosphotransferase/UDP-N-acetylglucosamine-1-phosphate transferase